jgi:predicted TIM-barrel fold metal-dependent hydrolase
MMRFDASAWVGIWPFTAVRTTSLADLVSDLRAVGMSGAAISPLNAVLGPDPRLANRDLLAEAEAFDAGEFDVRIVPMLDPSLPGWKRDLEQLVASDLVVGIRIVPNYHGYDVDGDDAMAIAMAVTESGLPLCVQVRMIDERAHHPLMKVSGVPLDGVARLARAVPDARILVGGAFTAELASIADVANVSAELSSVESGDAFGNAAKVLGADRLLLGTHAPLYTSAVAVAKVDLSDASEDERARVAWGNAASLFGMTEIG